MISSDLGQRLGGGASHERYTWPLLVREFGDLLPPYPGPGVIEFATLPAPPLIKPSLKEPRAVWRLMCGYSCAVKHYYGASYAFARVSEATVLQSRHYPTLAAAVPQLIDLKISPVAWAAFSIHAWRGYVVGGGKGKTWDAAPSAQRGPSRRTPPSPGWTYSRKRLAERVDWYSWTEAYHRGGRMHFSQAHLELVRRYESMKRAILTVASQRLVTRAEIAQVVQAHLSKRRFDQLKGAAETEAMLQLASWQAAIKQGEFIW